MSFSKQLDQMVHQPFLSLQGFAFDLNFWFFLPLCGFVDGFPSYPRWLAHHHIAYGGGLQQMSFMLCHKISFIAVSYAV